jgi:hypothetical protein
MRALIAIPARYVPAVFDALLALYSIKADAIHDAAVNEAAAGDVGPLREHRSELLEIDELLEHLDWCPTPRPLEIAGEREVIPPRSSMRSAARPSASTTPVPATGAARPTLTTSPAPTTQHGACSCSCVSSRSTRPSPIAGPRGQAVLRKRRRHGGNESDHAPARTPCNTRR